MHITFFSVLSLLLLLLFPFFHEWILYISFLPPSNNHSTKFTREYWQFWIKIRNRFYTYTGMPLVSKSEPNPALMLHEQIETILYWIEALCLENFKIRLPVTDQTSVIMGHSFVWSNLPFRDNKCEKCFQSL